MCKWAGVPLEFTVYPGVGHDVSWWPQERAGYEAFLASHPRQAHLERISWETERGSSLDRLGKRPSDVALKDVNSYQTVPTMERQLFDRDKPSGRIDAVRIGNAFDVKRAACSRSRCCCRLMRSTPRSRCA